MIIISKVYWEFFLKNDADSCESFIIGMHSTLIEACIAIIIQPDPEIKNSKRLQKKKYQNPFKIRRAIDTQYFNTKAVLIKNPVLLHPQ